jgi:hypothetical protein
MNLPQSQKPLRARAKPRQLSWDDPLARFNNQGKATNSNSFYRSAARGSSRNRLP